jgi:hypothetical protein
MTTWPPPKTGIPEGHYTFTLNQEPDLKIVKTAKGEFRRLDLYVTSSPGEHKHREGFVPWDPRYEALCEVLNVEHGKDIRMEGASFEADIEYEADKADPEKSWPRLKNIIRSGEFCPKTGDGDGDIPF